MEEGAGGGVLEEGAGGQGLVEAAGGKALKQGTERWGWTKGLEEG